MCYGCAFNLGLILVLYYFNVGFIGSFNDGNKYCIQIVVGFLNFIDFERFCDNILSLLHYKTLL